MLLLAINIIVSVWNVAFGHWPTHWWSTYWLIFGIGQPFVIAFITLIWFGIGGLIDIRHFFRDLRVAARDASDDGTVHHDDDRPDRPRPHEKTFGESSLTR
jgi:hypothetical protein